MSTSSGSSVRSEDQLPSPIQGTSEMANMIRSKDWSLTVLGPVEGWPEILLGMVNTLLQSPNPYALYWGEDLLLFYNDVYRAFLGVEASGESWGARRERMAGGVVAGRGTL